MATSGSKLYLYDTAAVARTHTVTQEGLDVFFPPGISWTEVLDCRIHPYTGKSLEENCDYATHVRKLFILVTEDQVAKSTPPSTEPGAAD